MNDVQRNAIVDSGDPVQDCQHYLRQVDDDIQKSFHPTRDAYQVQGIPTLILFRDGTEIARHEGAIARPQLQAFLDAHL